MTHPEVKPTDATLTRDVGVLAERMAGLTDSVDRLYEQGRENHRDNKSNLSEFKTQVEARMLSFGEDLREVRLQHADLKSSVEADRNQSKGIITAVRFLMAVTTLGPVSAAIIYLLSR